MRSINGFRRAESLDMDPNIIPRGFSVVARAKLRFRCHSPLATILA
jgi:hypothetical protein